MHDCVDCTLREQRRHCESHIGRVHDFLNGDIDNPGKSTAAQAGIETYCSPTSFHICLIRLFETWRSGDRAISIAVTAHFVAN